MNSLQHYLLFSLLLISSFGFTQNKEFIRVFDSEGKKIHAGFITSADENFLHLKRGSKAYTLPYLEIGYIKTFRSFGHDSGLGAGIGLGISAIFGAIVLSDTGDTGIGGALGAGIAGGGAAVLTTSGFLTGTIIWLLKKKKTYHIQGDPVSWELFRNSLAKPDR
ncbi:hypothetical protein [Robertkochia aurantiaca]|uniref:hypothetical protein n=1 Tax=Robertkochia aurantiaca TaxID=2873700 RepID=UPI001CCA0F0C|nr:hypothetical protein [Robertkochia sp. 3YJGBD-33]